MIKAILFDVDGVLIDSFEGNHKFINDLFTKAGYQKITRNKYQTLFHENLTGVIKKSIPDIPDSEVQRIWQMGNDRAVKYPVHLLKMPISVHTVIKELAQTYKLGIVSNRLRNGVFEFHKMAAIKDYFSIVVAYEDTINHKPHPEPLLFAAKQLQVDVHKCVYVGDMETDAQAAHAANMKIIICSKDRFHSADGYTKDFGGLPDAIEKLQ
jgi:pyrophosphatase PpaX